MRALYQQHANHNTTIRHLVAALNVTERTLHIVMRASPDGWRHTEQDARPTSACA